MAVDVGVADLIRNYVALRDAAAGASGQIAHLMLFYAVECGLKAAYLGKSGINARGTESLPEHLRNHDLRTLARELKLDATILRTLRACRRKHNSASTVQHHELHQAWRYGATLNHEDEQLAISALEALSEWCRKEHGR